jgi:hypothetical protein
MKSARATFAALLDQLRRVATAVGDGGEPAPWAADERVELRELLDAVDLNPSIKKVLAIELDRRRRARAA